MSINGFFAFYFSQFGDLGTTRVSQDHNYLKLTPGTSPFSIIVPLAGAAVVFILIAAICSNASGVVANYWLTKWSSKTDVTSSPKAASSGVQPNPNSFWTRPQADFCAPTPKKRPLPSGFAYDAYDETEMRQMPSCHRKLICNE